MSIKSDQYKRNIYTVKCSQYTVLFFVSFFFFFPPVNLWRFCFKEQKVMCPGGHLPRWVLIFTLCQSLSSFCCDSPAIMAPSRQALCAICSWAGLFAACQCVIHVSEASIRSVPTKDWAILLSIMAHHRDWIFGSLPLVWPVTTAFYEGP